MRELNNFLSGGTMALSAVVALFFLRFWRMSGDRLFAMFAAAFALFAVERWLLLLAPADGEYRPYVYLVRLVGFLVIAAAIISKNRRSRQP